MPTLAERIKDLAKAVAVLQLESVATKHYPVAFGLTEALCKLEDTAMVEESWAESDADREEYRKSPAYLRRS